MHCFPVVCILFCRRTSQKHVTHLRLPPFELTLDKGMVCPECKHTCSSHKAQPVLLTDTTIGIRLQGLC